MQPRGITKVFFGSLLLVFLPSILLSQVYTTSGSTGSDGALSFPSAKSGDTIIFNPAAFTPPLDPSGDGVFNFTTINIPAGVTIQLSGQYLHNPVYWLASGNVDIEGTLDLDGAVGAPFTNLAALRTPSVPGAGGYPGGVGADTTSNTPAEPGFGPQGGAANNCGANGGFGANVLLVPLFGGSGGGGSVTGGAGGAGGGAILIASSTSITVNGGISVGGGNGSEGASYQAGGGGGGGGIRLVAQTITGTGRLAAAGGIPGDSNCGVTGYPGIIRLEANQFAFSGQEIGTVSSGTPFATFAPTAANPMPTVKVVSVGGVAVIPNPTGSVATPDVTINSAVAVPIVVQATNLPVGTVVHLQIYSDNGPDILADTPGLAGTPLAATVNVMFPSGFSRSFVTASFNTGGTSGTSSTSVVSAVSKTLNTRASP